MATTTNPTTTTTITIQQAVDVLEQTWLRLHHQSHGQGPKALAMANKASGVIEALSDLTQQDPLDILDDLVERLL